MGRTDSEQLVDQLTQQTFCPLSATHPLSLRRKPWPDLNRTHCSCCVVEDPCRSAVNSGCAALVARCRRHACSQALLKITGLQQPVPTPNVSQLPFSFSRPTGCKLSKELNRTSIGIYLHLRYEHDLQMQDPSFDPQTGERAAMDPEAATADKQRIRTGSVAQPREGQ